MSELSRLLIQVFILSYFLLEMNLFFSHESLGFRPGLEQTRVFVRTLGYAEKNGACTELNRFDLNRKGKIVLYSEGS